MHVHRDANVTVRGHMAGLALSSCQRESNRAVGVPWCDKTAECALLRLPLPMPATSPLHTTHHLLKNGIRRRVDTASQRSTDLGLLCWSSATHPPTACAAPGTAMKRSRSSLSEPDADEEVREAVNHTRAVDSVCCLLFPPPQLTTPLPTSCCMPRVSQQPQLCPASLTA